MDLVLFEPRARAIMGVCGLQGRWSFRWLQQVGVAGHADFLDSEIRLSRAYVHENNEAVLLDTIYHLCAHALSDRESHSKEWKAAAREMGVAIDSSSEYYQKLLQQEVIPENWRTVVPRNELWVFRSCLAPIKRRHSTSVALR
jgi:hypothetical protein